MQRYRLTTALPILLGIAAHPAVAQDSDTGAIQLPIVSGILEPEGTLPADSPLVLRGTAPPPPDDTAILPAQPDDAPIRLFGPRIEFVAPPEADVAEAPVVEEDPRRVAGLWPTEAGTAIGSSARFNGESDSIEFTLFAPAGDMPSEIILGAISSAFVQPNRSELRVSIDGTEIGAMALDSIAQMDEQSFSVPPGLLEPGRNLVRVDVSQTHRHFCGADAVYDLWTNLDLRRSGVAYDPTRLGIAGSGFVTALATTRAEGKSVKLRRMSDGEMIDEMLAAVRGLNQVMGGGLSFRVVEGPLGNAGHGPEVLLFNEDIPGIDFEVGPGDQQMLVFRASEEAQPDLFDALGAPMAAPAVPYLPIETAVPLSSLGLDGVQISDHLWEQAIQFRLPEDWMVETNAQAELRLDFAYVSGLPDGARLRFIVNDRVVRTIPLDRVGRQTVKLLPVRFDARFLHAGRNVIGFEISLPGSPSDEPCPIERRPLVELGTDTTLKVPASPSMHMPGLNRAMAAVETGSLRLSEREIAEGATLDDLLAFASVVPAVSSSTDASVRPTLTILRPIELSQSQFGDFVISEEPFLSALKRSREDAARAASARNREPQLGSLETEPTDGGQSLFALGGVTGGRGFDLGYISNEVVGRVEDVVVPIRQYAFPDGQRDLTEWLATHAAQAILFQLNSSTPDYAYVVLAEDADADRVAGALARSMTTEAPLDGHVAVLTRAGDWEIWHDQTRIPVLEEEITLANWNRVVGNYASSRPLLYVGGLIAIAIFSAFVASSYVAGTRGRR